MDARRGRSLSEVESQPHSSAGDHDVLFLPLFLSLFLLSLSQGEWTVGRKGRSWLRSGSVSSAAVTLVLIPHYNASHNAAVFVGKQILTNPNPAAAASETLANYRRREDREVLQLLRLCSASVGLSPKNGSFLLLFFLYICLYIFFLVCF